MEEKDRPQFWRELKPGSTISLNDAQALEDSMQTGLGVSARDYIVREIRSIKQLQGPVEWQLFNVEDAEERLWFLVKIVDTDIALRVYFEAEGFQPGTRSELIDREMSWLFQEPEDPDDFRCNELAYAGKSFSPSKWKARRRKSAFASSHKVNNTEPALTSRGSPGRRS